MLCPPSCQVLQLEDEAEFMGQEQPWEEPVGQLDMRAAGALLGWVVVPRVHEGCGRLSCYPSIGVWEGLVGALLWLPPHPAGTAWAHRGLPPQRRQQR